TDQGQWISVLNGDFVDTTIVDAEAQAAVAFLDKENRSTGGRRGSLDVPFGKVLLNVLIKCLEFHLRERVQRAERRRGAGLKRNPMVIGPVRRKDAGRLFTEDFCEVIVITGDRRSWILTGRGRGLGLGSRGLWCLRQREAEELIPFDGSLKGSGA